MAGCGCCGCSLGSKNLDWFNFISISVDVTCQHIDLVHPGANCISTGSASNSYNRVDVIDTSFIPGGCHPEIDCDTQFALWQNDLSESGLCTAYQTPFNVATNPFVPAGAYANALVGATGSVIVRLLIGDTFVQGVCTPPCTPGFTWPGGGTFPPSPDDVFDTFNINSPPVVFNIIGTHFYSATHDTGGDPRDIVSATVTIVVA